MSPLPERPLPPDRRNGGRLTQGLLIGALVALMAFATWTLG